MANRNQGISSRNNVNVGVRTGGGSRGIRPGGAESVGKRYGSHITEGPGRSNDTGYRGPKFEEGKSFQPVKFGNELATNVGKGGPGAGREVMRCGTQGTQGSVNPGQPRPAATPWFKDYPGSK